MGLGPPQSVCCPPCCILLSYPCTVFQSILFSSLPFHSITLLSLPFLFSPFPFHATLFHGFPLCSISFYFIRFSSIPFYSILFYSTLFDSVLPCQALHTCTYMLRVVGPPMYLCFFSFLSTHLDAATFLVTWTRPHPGSLWASWTIKRKDPPRDIINRKISLNRKQPLRQPPPKPLPQPKIETNAEHNRNQQTKGSTADQFCGNLGKKHGIHLRSSRKMLFFGFAFCISQN